MTARNPRKWRPTLEAARDEMILTAGYPHQIDEANCWLNVEGHPEDEDVGGPLCYSSETGYTALWTPDGTKELLADSSQEAVALAIDEWCDAEGRERFLLEVAAYGGRQFSGAALVIGSGLAALLVALLLVTLL